MPRKIWIGVSSSPNIPSIKYNENEGFPGGSTVNNLPANAGGTGLILELGRCPEGNGNPLQDSCLGNPMDRGAWWATVHEVPRVRQTGATITILSKISFSAYLLLMPSSVWVSWTDQPRITLGCILGSTLFLLCHTFPISSLSADGFFSCYPNDLVCSQLSGSAVIPPFFSVFLISPFS